MAYIYQIGFGINADQMSQLKIGSSLERVLGYLRTLLPSQEGYITSRAMHSLENEEQARVIVESVWQDWETFLHHRDSNLAEDKIILEFEPHISRDELVSSAYQEVD
ncbi:MAG: hypothetical protein PVI04_04745 [Anaerolineales bacterium]|jgi:hypothetical protein